jgi:hypothetical protein
MTAMTRMKCAELPIGRRSRVRRFADYMPQRNAGV